MPSQARNAPFFLVGSARSGTTLLRDLLRSHSRLFLGTETRFIPFLQVLHGDPAGEREARRLGAAILRMLGHPTVWTALEPEDFASCRTFREAASLPFERAAAAAGKRRWGDKSPRYVEHIPLLFEIFPDARIVHIVRDGRDVALSMMRTHFASQTVHHAAHTWRRRVLAGREAFRRFGPDRVHELRYEDLVDGPEGVLRRLLAFLDEPFEPAVLTRSPIPAATDRPSARPGAGFDDPAQVDPSRARRWSQDMSRPDRVMFESIAGDALEAFGYPTEGIATRIHPVTGWCWTAVEAWRTLQARRRTGTFNRHWLGLWLLRQRARWAGLR